MNTNSKIMLIITKGFVAQKIDSIHCFGNKESAMHYLRSNITSFDNAQWNFKMYGVKQALHIQPITDISYCHP